MVKKNRMEHRDGGGSAVGGDGARFALIQTDSNPVQTRSEMSSVKMNRRNKDIDKVRWKGGELGNGTTEISSAPGGYLGLEGKELGDLGPWSPHEVYISGLPDLEWTEKTLSGTNKFFTWDDETSMFSGILVYAIPSTSAGLHGPLLHRRFPVSSLGL